jgi:hypothetical protein
MYVGDAGRNIGARQSRLATASVVAGPSRYGACQSPRSTLTQDVPMLRFLAANWITRRLARPLGRAIPNPYLRAAAVTGAGVLVTRMLQKRRRR